MNLGLSIALVLLATWSLLLLVFAEPLRARWREPVFKGPILVFESDDWGAGPLEQARLLQEIAALLCGFRDAAGAHPVMTLGIVFEVPDSSRMGVEGAVAYRASTLADDAYGEVRSAIRTGVDRGVFSPQLHGQCHYWRDALMRTASCDAAVRAWVTSPDIPATEALPSHLQTRWADASSLPSRSLDPDQVRDAVAEETASYRRLFGTAPCVAVPPTFVWDARVEHAWRDAGVEVIITPGSRATCRDELGTPGCIDRAMLTGDLSDAGQRYLVRDVYFEPARGHTPQHLACALAARARQGRACLAEMHRANFVTEPQRSMEALRAAIAMCLQAQPAVRFCTPVELASAIATNDATLLATAARDRVRAWLHRLEEIPRFARLGRYSGLFGTLRLLARAL